VNLSHPMRDMLWTLAQHKYGWTHVSRGGGRLQVAEALVRRGLVEWSAAKPASHHQPVIVATAAGCLEIESRWPVSPFVLGTYAHQPGSWTPREGVAA
jgi:hypothetical protein